MAEWLAVAIFSGIYSVVAIATQMSMVAGAFSLAAVGWMGVGAYATAIGSTKWGMDPFLAAIPAMGVAAVCGPLIFLPARRVQGLYYGLITLAFVLVVQIVVTDLEYTGGATGIYGVPLRTTFGTVLLVLMCAIAVAVYFARGSLGRSMRAAGQDRVVAQSLGVNVARLHLILGSVTAVMAVMAGTLYAAYVGVVDPTFVSFAAVITLVVMVVVGGRRSWLGAVLGATLITALPEILRPLSEWRDAFNGTLLILTMVLLPGGLFELMTRLAPASRPSRSSLRRSGKIAQAETSAPELSP